jgi:DNA (cytosine-5)-methyltransferase 1
VKVLNLYSGLGGNRKHWKNVQVVAVEKSSKIADVYQELYPEDTVVVGDAHQYLLDHYDEFDFVWSSPPCQTHSKMMKGTRHKAKRYPDLKLYEEIIFLQHFFKGKWVVENVKPYYDPLIKPTAILGRHYFWSNFDIDSFDVPSPRNFISSCNVSGSEMMKEWLGIHYEGNIYYEKNHCPAQVLRNCVHPDLGNHVFQEMLSEWSASCR